MNKIIEVEGLKKNYGDVEAVRGIDFYVEQGTLFAFLGPNGAGKSTTIDMISTLLAPDEGQVTVDGNVLGKNDNAIRAMIGIVFQDSILDNNLTVKENLDVRGSFYGMDKEVRVKGIKQAVAATDVVEFLNRKYGKLSGGQRRRADIARALVNTPKILFLDEPTTGLDPQTRKSVWETIGKLRQEHGMTIFLTTHYMEEAAQADYITIMDHGELKAKGTPLELKEEYATDVLKIAPLESRPVEEYLRGKGIGYRINGEEIDIPVRRTVDTLPIIDAMKQYFKGFEVIRGSMDDVFINITGAEVRN